MNCVHILELRNDTFTICHILLFDVMLFLKSMLMDDLDDAL